MSARIKVREIKPGMFSTERYVVVDIGENEYALLVDEGYLNDKTLEVQVVESDKEMALIELPRAPFNAGSRVRIPKNDLVFA